MVVEVEVASEEDEGVTGAAVAEAGDVVMEAAVEVAVLVTGSAGEWLS